MPTSARKSSLGNRRATQKAHIPYRGDNPEVGKKTGIAVQHVERKSDGFELFDEVMQAADGLTPPQRKAKRLSMAMGRHPFDFDDEDGEQPMEIESPVQHLINMRPPISPPSIRRRSSIRPVARTSDLDFDQIPSPRPIPSLHRSILTNGSGPSTLSHSRNHREPVSPVSPNGAGEYDYGGEEDMTYDQSPESRRVSFTQIDQDEEEDEEEEEDREPTPKPSRKQKGKQKAPPLRDQHEEPEEEIAQGLEDVDLDSDTQQDSRPTKRSKGSVKTSDRPQKSRSKKEDRSYREGTRRSQRQHMKPLAYWRGERYVYGRPDHQTGPIQVAPIREVIRIPEEPVVPFGGKRKRASSRTRSRSRGIEQEEAIPPALPVENPEEGWDDRTESKCVVVHYTSRQEVERRIAWTAKMVEPKLSANNAWSFDKIFNDDDFIAAGQLVIPPKGRKPSKLSKDNTYVFYVIEGAVNLKIHNTSMVLTTGAMFMVPRGNYYFIENICNRDARLFFTQARKMVMTDEEKLAKEKQDAEIRQKRLSGRSSSAGPTPTKKSRVMGRAFSLGALKS